MYTKERACLHIQTYLTEQTMLKPEPKRFFDIEVRHIYANIILNTQFIKIVLTKPIKKKARRRACMCMQTFIKIKSS